MKTKIAFNLLTFCIIISSIITCKSQTVNNDDQIKNMLKEFYTSYINERSNMPEDSKKTEKLIKKYCSLDLQKQLQEDIDYDLLLDGQFCKKEWLNTMSIKRDIANECIYTVSFEYVLNNAKKQKVIRLQLSKNGNGYLIDKVIE